ncbi:MAG TPA: type II toxin-antitoxin system RelE/ParE family toxin [Caulobacteraceae bacterium]|jgi:putative addiction module killer protein
MISALVWSVFWLLLSIPVAPSTKGATPRLGFAQSAAAPSHQLSPLVDIQKGGRLLTGMPEVRQTTLFSEWLRDLRDKRAQAVIARRIARVGQGNFGDAKTVGDRVSELRIDFGPGYRAYYTRKGRELIVLLCGGDKSSQPADIERAKEMAAEFHDGD